MKCGLFSTVLFLLQDRFNSRKLSECILLHSSLYTSSVFSLGIKESFFIFLYVQQFFPVHGGKKKIKKNQ